jgi:hypothetical protein
VIRVTSPRKALVLTALAVVAVGGTAAAAPSAPRAQRSDRLQDVRVCGGPALDRHAGECTRDESGAPIRSPAFNCSARARGESGERFSGRFLYRGRPFPVFGTAVTGHRRGLYVYVTAGPYPLPGGPWACELRVGGEQVRKSFRSAGPTAPIVYVLACPASKTTSAGPARVCVRDETATAFKSTEPITCSAVFAGGKGKLATIEFLREGKRAFSGDFELPLPITAAGPRLDPAPKLLAGNWACRWSLAGRIVALKRFRVV